jgi:mannose-6-phosphate isomerase-like protein (cupin superfamily)
VGFYGPCRIGVLDPAAQPSEEDDPMSRILTSLATFATLAAFAGALGMARAKDAGGDPPKAATGDRPKSAAFDLGELAAHRAKGSDPWLEFLSTSTLRTGLYALPAGGVDPQTPHREDEVYHVVAGRAVLDVDGESHPVHPGSILYVRAGVPHHFHSIEEELRVVVFFSRAGE